MQLTQIFLAMLAVSAPQTPSLSAEAVVQRQVDAYNAFDIEAFLDAHAETAEVRFDAGGHVIKGRAALRAFYEPGFRRRDTTVRIGHRTVLGNTVVDEEYVKIRGNEVCCAVLIFKVTDGKIGSVDVFLSPQLLQAFRS